MSQQTHGNSLWQEAAGSGGAPSVMPMVLRNGSGDWELIAASDAQGAALDPGDGSRTIFDTSAEWVFISDGAGGFQLASSGTAAAVLADDGAGGLVLTPIGSGVKAGRALPDSRGDITNVRNDAAELHFVSVGGNIMSY